MKLGLVGLVEIQVLNGADLPLVVGTKETLAVGFVVNEKGFAGQPLAEVGAQEGEDPVLGVICPTKTPP